MYICNRCGAVFSEPRSYKEHHPYGMGYATENWSVCPSCGDTDFVEAVKCDICGEYVAELEDGLCEECWQEEHGEEE